MRICYSSVSPLQEAVAIGFEKVDEVGFWEQSKQEMKSKMTSFCKVFDELGLFYSEPEGGYFVLVNLNKVKLPEGYEFRCFRVSIMQILHTLLVVVIIVPVLDCVKKSHQGVDIMVGGKGFIVHDDRGYVCLRDDEDREAWKSHFYKHCWLSLQCVSPLLDLGDFAKAS